MSQLKHHLDDNLCSTASVCPCPSWMLAALLSMAWELARLFSTCPVTCNKTGFINCTRVLCTHQVPGHVSPGARVQDTGLGAHPVQVYHGEHIGGHTVNGHPLVLTIDCVVEAALLGSHHPEPRAHAQTVQVTAVSVPGEVSLHWNQGAEENILQILEQT